MKKTRHCEGEARGNPVDYRKGRLEMETFYVYILTNRNNRVLYTGVTNDLVRRVYEHRQHLDKGSFTAQYNVEKLVYFEETSSSRAAIEREKQIKGWKRAKKNELVNKTNPEWEDLWEQIL